MGLLIKGHKNSVCRDGVLVIETAATDDKVVAAQQEGADGG